MLKFSRIPTWEMENPMGYRRVWVLRGMVYEGVDCNNNEAKIVVSGFHDLCHDPKAAKIHRLDHDDEELLILH
jgi:hypothetical protein